MKKPLIGVTPSLDQETKDSTCRPTYLAAIRHAGGIPVILPLKAETEDLKQLVETLDGFLFTGGPDIHPFYFGEETHEKCGNVSPERDQMELSLLPLVMAAKKPVLGICRGIQLLNVGLGGTLYQPGNPGVSNRPQTAISLRFLFSSHSHHPRYKTPHHLPGRFHRCQQFPSPGHQSSGKWTGRHRKNLRRPDRSGRNA